MRSIATLVVLAFVTALLVTCAAHAQMSDEEMRQRGHMQYHEEYKTWCQPGQEKPCPKVKSCCDAKKTDENGNITGHCYPTEAELRPSADPAIKGLVYWALRYDRKTWIEIPESKYVKEKNPDTTGRAAHLCDLEMSEAILCFVPPTGAL